MKKPYTRAAIARLTLLPEAGSLIAASPTFSDTPADRPSGKPQLAPPSEGAWSSDSWSNT